VKEFKYIKDLVNQICEIKGSWLNNLVIDGKTYWDITTDIPDRQIPMVSDIDQMQIASSDWRFREDLLWLKYDYMKIA
jgi:hypothetical protein